MPVKWNPMLPTQALSSVPASMQGMVNPPAAPLLSAERMSLRWVVLRKLKPLFVIRTWATLSRREPVNLIGVPSGFLVLKAPPQELPQPPPEPPEQPTATRAATRASRARLRPGRDVSVDGIRVRPPGED